MRGRRFSGALRRGPWVHRAGCERGVCLVAAVAAAIAGAGCGREIEGITPPEQALYFPIGLQVSSCAAPTAPCSAYVVNSNFDRRYNSGWISVLDIDKLIDSLDASCAGTCAADTACVVADPVTCDALSAEARPALCSESAASCRTLTDEAECDGGCADYRTCVDDGAGGGVCAAEPFLTEAIVEQLKIPSLGGQMAIAPDDSFAVVAPRGGEPLVQVEMSQGRGLSCGDGNSTEGLTTELQKTDCDRFHLTRLVAVDPAPIAALADEMLPADRLNIQEVAVDRRFDLDIADVDAVTEDEVADPYAIHIFERKDGGSAGKLYVAIGYLGGSFVSLLEVRDTVPPQLNHVRLVGPLGAGVGALAVYPGAAESTYLAATSQFIDADSDLSSLFDIDVGRTLDGDEDHFRAHPVGDRIGGLEMLDIVFEKKPTPARAYVADRDPDSVIVIDTRLEQSTVRKADGSYEEVVQPRYLPVGSVSLPGRPSGLTFVARSGADLLAVTSFDHDALFILSIFGDHLRVDRRIDWVGAGPYQVRHVNRRGRDLLLVTSFFDHSVAIVDVTADDPQRFAVVGHVRAAAAETSHDRAHN